ncbi:unnamed protein product [Parajaminaea phylloscopi]
MCAQRGKECVWVIGATCGIGQAIARDFARRGWRVTATYHCGVAEAESLAASDPLITTKALDLCGGRDAMRRFVEELVEEQGAVPKAVVVCAASIVPACLEDVEESHFDRPFHSIVRGPLFLIQALCPLLRPGARIVVFSSALARTSVIFDDRYALYASAKAALEQLVKYLSKTLGKHECTINAVAPGPVDTPGLHRQLAGNTPRLASGGRLGTTDEVASVVRFLSSAEASWVNGAVLNVSGGMCVGA